MRLSLLFLIYKNDKNKNDNSHIDYDAIKSTRTKCVWKGNV